MDLISYLSKNFLTLPELLKKARISENELRILQKQETLPQCSYRLNLSINCDSMFGDHKSMASVEYFSRYSCEWLKVLRSEVQGLTAFDVFSTRYKAELSRLNNLGFESCSAELNLGLDKHLQEEWRQFLDGSYGLCTSNGTPEEIAAKSLTGAIILPLARRDTLNITEKIRLKKAVDLLADVSAEFAPHERLRSSRYKLVERVRQKFSLGTSSVSQFRHFMKADVAC